MVGSDFTRRLLRGLLWAPFCAPWGLWSWREGTGSPLFWGLVWLSWGGVLLLPLLLFPPELMTVALLLGLGQQALLGLFWSLAQLLRASPDTPLSGLTAMLFHLSACGACLPVGLLAAKLFRAQPAAPWVGGLSLLLALLAATVGHRLVQTLPAPAWEHLPSHASRVFLLVALCLLMGLMALLTLTWSLF
ncbi:MAG: hypothetical protein ACKO6N_21045 [Myxococcota bacterium]